LRICARKVTVGETQEDGDASRPVAIPSPHRIIGTECRKMQRGESCGVDEGDAGDVGEVCKGEDGGRREDEAGNGVDVGWSGFKEDVGWQEECSMLQVQVRD